MRTCPWPIDLDATCQSFTPPLDENDEKVVRILEAVSSMMSRWSAYSIGLCQESVRPLSICPKCRSACCGAADGIRLSSEEGSPVHDVTEVRLDGLPVPEEQWRYDRPTGMLWAVPPLTWPTSDRRDLPSTAEGTFEVDITTGAEPDGWAMWVAEQLAIELLRSCFDQKGCRLPRNVTSVSGQGVTVQLSDEEINHMIPEVGAWVAAVNPAKATLPARISSPEVAKAKRGERRRPGIVLSVAGGGGCCGR